MIVLVIAVGLTIFLWDRTKRTSPPPISANVNETASNSAVESPSLSASPVESSTPVPENPTAEPGLSPQATPAAIEAPPPSYVGTVKLIVPVAGVRPDQLLDTFTDARSEGRSHDAIDIQAPLGTPVVAASDGEIIKLFQSERGGTTIYQLSGDKRLIYYYAHLQRYADGLMAGKLVRQGEVIAYVGDTGNAGAGNYHLHFSISVVADPKRYWEGTNINPYPLFGK
ncbi:MAG TPA: peptidoglycan DD-metalloendopeptidase family protein [Pyrinomonadaceae bacterium]|nr:peptidoglycan DD-metalloendopeptidase family protein [Pyrinomonadaceae bacterium]